MIRFKRLLGRIFISIKHLSKKAFTKGLVVITAGMVTVLLLGANGFISNSKTNYNQIKQPDEDYTDDALAMDLNPFINQDLSFLDLNLDNESKPQIFKEEEDLKTVFQTASNNVLDQAASVIYTEDDYMSLVKIVEAEATGEDMIGKIMVANVVLNRVNSGDFPDSIYDVIYERCNGVAQFSPVDDGRLDSVPLTTSSYEAVERALEGEDYSNGATFFVARDMASPSAVSWFDNHLKKVAQHGVHEFFAY